MLPVKEGWFYSKRVTLLLGSYYCLLKIIIFFTAEGITSSSEKTRPHSDGTGQVHAAAERAWLSSALLVWVGFNYIHLSWLPSQVHLTLPSSFQLFFLSHFFSSSLSSLSSEQAEEKNAEAKQACKERKCVQTILLHN